MDTYDTVGDVLYIECLFFIHRIDGYKAYETLGDATHGL